MDSSFELANLYLDLFKGILLVPRSGGISCKQECSFYIFLWVAVLALFATGIGKFFFQCWYALTPNKC